MKSTNFPSKTQGSGVASLVPADASSAAFSADADVSLPKPFVGAGAGAGGGSPAPSLSAALTAFLALRSKISWVSRSSPWFGGWKTNLWGKYGRSGRRVGEWWDLNGILGKWWYDNGIIMRTWMRMIPSQKWIVVVGGAWGYFLGAKKSWENGEKSSFERGQGESENCWRCWHVKWWVGYVRRNSRLRSITSGRWLFSGNLIW